jgi:ribonuclease E
VVLAPTGNGITPQAEAVEVPRPELEPTSRRPELEFVAVPMDASQEEVYGWMGLNPALLLDPVPTGDNLVMRVVRPGSDPDAVLEEARQQASSSGSRRRRRGRGGDSRAAATDSALGATDGEADSDDNAPPLALAAPADIVTVEVPAHRRGGASQEPPGPEPAEETAEASDAANADPRRRRRRSSATV